MRYGLIGFMLLLGCEAPVGIIDPEPEPFNEPLNLAESRALLTGINDLIEIPDRIFRERGDTLLADCPDGGQMLLSASDDGDATSFWLIVMLEPRDCKYTVNGNAFTLTEGTLTHRVTYQINTVQYTIEGKMTGTLSWLLDERFGDCEFDMEFLIRSTNTLEARYTGKACGFDDAEFTVDLSRG